MTNIIIGQTGGAVSDPEARWLVDQIDEWRVGSEKPRFDPGYFHCSQLGESDEQLIAQYRGILSTETRTARELRVFDNGNDRDGSWKRYLKESGLSAVTHEDSRAVSMLYLRLRGTLDDIAVDPQTDEMYVIEYKTINPYAFGQLTEPKEQHLLQVCSYMACTRIEQAIVIYENKGSQAVRAFYVPFDAVMWAGIVVRLNRLRREAEAMDATVPDNVLDISLALNRELSR